MISCRIFPSYTYLPYYSIFFPTLQIDFKEEQKSFLERFLEIVYNSRRFNQKKVVQESRPRGAFARNPELFFPENTETKSQDNPISGRKYLQKTNKKIRGI